MSDKQADTSLDALASQAQQKVDVQNARLAAERAAGPAAPSQLKKIAAAVLVAAFAGALWTQWPRFTEPYAVPDPATFSGIAEADLDTVASLITAFRYSQGRLPNSLEEVNLPDGLRDLIAQSRIKYQLDGDRYRMTWISPQWEVTFDSATGQTAVQKAAR